MTRLFLGPSHRVSLARSLSGVSASTALGRTLPAPICPPYDSSDYSAVFPPPPPKTDPLLGLILSGATHVHWTLPRPSTRRVVTFPLLLTIGHRIAGSGWDLISRQTVWAACTTAFFSSARLGELLSYRAHAHDPSADLLWRDVLFHSPTAVLIQLKSPKSAAPTGKFLDLFTFSGYHCCPVLALKALWRLHLEAGLACLDAPVFRFRSGRNLTPAHLNELLAALLTDICSPGDNTITCHSF